MTKKLFRKSNKTEEARAAISKYRTACGVNMRYLYVRTFVIRRIQSSPLLKHTHTYMKAPPRVSHPELANMNSKANSTEFQEVMPAQIEIDG